MPKNKKNKHHSHLFGKATNPYDLTKNNNVNTNRKNKRELSAFDQELNNLKERQKRLVGQKGKSNNSKNTAPITLAPSLFATGTTSLAPEKNLIDELLHNEADVVVVNNQENKFPIVKKIPLNMFEVLSDEHTNNPHAIVLQPSFLAQSIEEFGDDI
jgi:hypothetical protein